MATRDEIRTAELRMDDLRSVIEGLQSARWAALRAGLDTNPYDQLQRSAEADLDAEHARWLAMIEAWEAAS